MCQCHILMSSHLIDRIKPAMQSCFQTSYFKITKERREMSNLSLSCRWLGNSHYGHRNASLLTFNQFSCLSFHPSLSPTFSSTEAPGYFLSRDTFYRWDNCWPFLWVICIPVSSTTKTSEILFRSIVGTEDSSASCQAQLYNNQLFSDVTLFFGSEKFFGHWAIIATKSDVFKANFSNDWNDKAEVKLQDVDVDALKTILWFMYTDEIKMEPKKLLDTITLAHRYLVTGLFDVFTSDEFVERFGPTEVWKFVEFGVKVSDIGFTNKYLELVDKNVEELLSLDDFLSVSPQVIGSFIDRSSLAIKLFKFLLKWAEKRKEKTSCLFRRGPTLRDIMKPFISKIRFTLMSLKEFTQVVEPTNILSSSTVQSIKDAITSGNKRSKTRDSVVDAFAVAKLSKCAKVTKPRTVVITMYCTFHKHYVCAACTTTCHVECSRGAIRTWNQCQCSLTHNPCHQTTTWKCVFMSLIETTTLIVNMM